MQTNHHGNAMRIHQCGVLILGSPNIGKSQLSLELLERGHALISDDATLLEASNGKLLACSNPILHGLLNLRSIGTINVSDHYSADQLLYSQPIELVVRLEKRPSCLTNKITLNGLELPLYTLSTQANVSIALLVETLAKKIQLEKAGHSAEAELKLRQQLAIQHPIS